MKSKKLEQKLMDEIKEILTWKHVIIDNEIMAQYYVSTDGKVFSFKSFKYLTHQKTDDDYWFISINKNGKTRKCYIHRLVALAYIDNPENKPQINHIDGNKKNNTVTNLEWVTAKENTAHAMKLGTKWYYGAKGMENGRSVFTDEQIHAACKLLEEGIKTPKEISKITGVSRICLYTIRFGNGWSHIAKDYKIPRKFYSCSHPGNPLTPKIIALLKEGKSTREILEKLNMGVGAKNPRGYTLIGYLRRKHILDKTSTTIENAEKQK